MLMNATMEETNKTALAHFPEMAMWRLLILINTAVVDTQNEFTGYMAQKFLDDSYIQVPVKYDFSETFEREKFDGKVFVKGQLHYMKSPQRNTNQWDFNLYMPVFLHF